MLSTVITYRISGYTEENTMYSILAIQNKVLLFTTKRSVADAKLPTQEHHVRAISFRSKTQHGVPLCTLNNVVFKKYSANASDKLQK